MADPTVYNEAYGVAKSLGANAKVILSLFEAGIVESNFTNHLTATDHDSLGYLQQRPSTGWGTAAQVTNVSHATTAYVRKAIAYAAAHPTATAGQIAQAVQISAYPAKYDQSQSSAVALLAKVDPDLAKILAENDPTIGADTGIVQAGEGVLSGLTTQAAAVLTSVGKFIDTIVPVATTVAKLFLPSNLVRLVMGIFGAVFLGASIWFLGRELTA